MNGEKPYKGLSMSLSGFETVTLTTTSERHDCFTPELLDDCWGD